MCLVNPKIGSVSNRPGASFSLHSADFPHRYPNRQVEAHTCGMVTALAIIGGLIVAGLVLAYLVDRRARRRGDTLRGADQMQRSIKDARRDLRAWGRFRRANPNGPPKW